MRLPGTALRALAAALVVTAGLAACGSPSGPADPSLLLRQAKAAVDGATAIHFTLTTAGARGSTAIIGGEGDLARPDRLKGTFTVSVSGLQASIKVASGGGRFLAELPFSSSYQVTDPASFGVANPAQLISPNDGLSTILVDVQAPRSNGQTRIAGEVLDTVSGTVPGTALTALPDKDPSTPVGVVARISPSSHQLRQIALTGPIGTTGQATYTVTLTGYGENVNLALPST